MEDNYSDTIEPESRVNKLIGQMQRKRKILGVGHLQNSIDQLHNRRDGISRQEQFYTQ